MLFALLIQILFFGIVSILLLYYIFEQHRNRRMRKITHGIPGPKPLPLLGSALQFGTNSVELFKNIQKLVADYGPIVKVWIGPTLYFILSDIRDIEVVLSSNAHLNKPQVYDFLKAWLGTGLVSAPASKWRTQRKILTPAFHFKILETYVDIFNENATIFVDLLEKEVGKESFDIVPYIDNCTLDVICETAMATKINAQLNDESEFPKALKVQYNGRVLVYMDRRAFRRVKARASDAVLIRSFRPWLFPDAIFNISSLGKEYNKNLELINGYVDKVIAQKKKALAERKEEKKLHTLEQDTNTAEDYYGTKQRLVFLDLLLMYAEDPANHITDRDIRDEVNTFMFAGHDTTASTIGFAIYLLGSHSEVQNKVYEELESVFGDSYRDPTYQDLISLKYLEQVIKETLRLYPAVPYIGRLLYEDLTLPSGQVLPAGSSLSLVLYMLHRDPRVFPDPERFNPDNFLPERMIGRMAYAYTPFSAGPRNCIGQKFAMLEMKATLLRLVRRFKVVSKSPEPLLASQLILRSETGFHVQLEKRTQLA